MAWICIDAGTSVIKAVLLERTGAQLALARTSVPVLRPRPGYAEQDMEQVWRAAAAASREVLREYAGPVEGIVTTAQGDGVWLVGEDGRPMMNAILWNDGRAAGFTVQPELVRSAFAINGSVGYPGLPSAIWPWLRAHSPAVLKRARWSLSCNGWLHFKLTGSAVADLSDASNPLCDLRTRAYSPALLALYGIEELERLLPPIGAGFAPVGTLESGAARELGVAAGLPVVMAPYDIVTAAAGCGSVRSGEGCLILGTTICAEVLTDDPGLDRVPAGTTLALATGQYLRAMPTLTGCEAIDWAAAMLQAEAREAFEQLARSAPPGAGNLVFLPYLSPAGERAPFLDATARGSFHGLSLAHGREHLARAVLEGLSFAVRDCLWAALAGSPARLAVCGGGSRSEVWCQIIADVCGCEVARTTVEEVGAQGALYYALAATGEAATLEEAAHAGRQQSRCFVPNAAHRAVYDALYARFLRIRQAAAPIWNLMNSAADRAKEPA